MMYRNTELSLSSEVQMMAPPTNERAIVCWNNCSITRASSYFEGFGLKQVHLTTLEYYLESLGL